MTRAELLTFLDAHRITVVSSIGPDGAPQSAVVGYAVSDELSLSSTP